jgi:FkbM family methyltransferase
MKAALRSMYRRHAHRYPRLFNAQQRYGVLFKDQVGYVHDNDFHALNLFKLPPEALCVDIGANRGQSVTSIKTVLPQATIVSFEPNPVTFATLKVVAGRRSRVTALNMAVGLGDGVLQMWIPRWRGIQFDQLASGRRPDTTALAEEIRGYGFPSISAAEIELECVSVKRTALDALALKPDFVKIDVEGGERDVLESAQATLRTAKPLLMIERGYRREITDLLADFGYTRHIYRHAVLSLSSSDDRTCVNTFFAQPRHIPAPVRA